jgi:hypothetical protein
MFVVRADEKKIRMLLPVLKVALPARRTPFFAVAILFTWSLLAHQEVLAWGANGHRLISRLAIANLPTGIPAFLRTPKAAELVGEIAREPDRSKGTGNSHDHDLDPGHYINLSDDFTVADVVPIDPLPATREEYDTALRVNGTNEYKVGFLPYSIVDGWQQLQRDFAYWRADVAAEHSVASKAERAWFAGDRRLREMIILRDLGYWSHFVADASQPLHVSIHRDGWGDYPNPQGYSVTRGFHAAFEGAFVARYVRPEDVTKRLRPNRDCECSIQIATVAYLRETHSQLLPLFELEKHGAFSVDTVAGRDFTVDRLAAAVSELRDMIVTAWRTSVDSTVGHPRLPVRDIESGKVNPFNQMRGLD